MKKLLSFLSLTAVLLSLQACSFGSLGSDVLFIEQTNQAAKVSKSKKQCKYGWDCPSGYACEPQLLICVQVAGAHNQCLSNKDCRPGHRCLDGICQQSRENNTSCTYQDCPKGFSCEAGRCQPNE